VNIKKLVMTDWFLYYIRKTILSERSDEFYSRQISRIFFDVKWRINL
jgi:hypothetical protein